MKKLILVGIVAIAGFSFTACISEEIVPEGHEDTKTFNEGTIEDDDQF